MSQSYEAEPTYEAEAENYAIAPGETLAEWLDEHDMTQGQLAARLRMSTKHVNQMINGVASITPASALALETVTAIPASFWLAREAQYQEDLARLRRSREIEESITWLDEIPIAELRKRGHITAAARDKAGCVIEALRFFGTATVESWRAVYLRPQASFRQSEAHKVSPGAVAAWLRLGELEVDTRELPPFKSDALKQRLPQLRALTRASGDIGQQIVDVCSEAGVAVVFVPDVAGTRASGATHWVRNRPVIQLSLRGKSDDRFWFTFFHECAHVLLHGRGEVFIERNGGQADGETAGKEKEANDFSANLLIDPSLTLKLRELNSIGEVRSFAEEIGVSAGVVIGRIHNDEIRPWSWGAGLKKRVEFVAGD
ncbi:MAG: ImmA/IrrE family metallo-endopeptidase [Janthinobacterium lividum]